MVPKQWQVCTNSHAIILARIPTHCFRTCFLISQLDFLNTSSIISLMKTLIMSQFIHMIHLFLHFILTIQPIFLEHFYIFLILIFYATPIFYQKDGHKTVKKVAGRERPTTGKRTRRPYNSGNPPELTSNSSCSQRSETVHSENNRSHCRRLKGVNSSYPLRYALSRKIRTSMAESTNLNSH